jgi:hypothetical protein
MTADFTRFALVVWPYAVGFVLWIVACATWETTR